MYFRTLKEDLTHLGYKYKEGLNIYSKAFRSAPKYKDGLFFIDERYVLEFCGYDTKIAEVIIPFGLMIPIENQYKANRIILGKIRDLWTLETFEWLKACGVDLHVKNDRVLGYAAEGGHLEIVKFLVENNANINANKNYNPLLGAASYGYLEIVKFLVGMGADVHMEDDIAFHSAAERGHLDVVRFLVETGVDIHADNDFALRTASKNGQLDVVKYLVEQKTLFPAI